MERPDSDLIPMQHQNPRERERPFTDVPLANRPELAAPEAWAAQPSDLTTAALPGAGLAGPAPSGAGGRTGTPRTGSGWVPTRSNSTSAGRGLVNRPVNCLPLFIAAVNASATARADGTASTVATTISRFG